MSAAERTGHATRAGSTPRVALQKWVKADMVLPVIVDSSLRGWVGRWVSVVEWMGGVLVKRCVALVWAGELKWGNEL